MIIKQNRHIFKPIKDSRSYHHESFTCIKCELSICAHHSFEDLFRKENSLADTFHYGYLSDNKDRIIIVSGDKVLQKPIPRCKISFDDIIVRDIIK